ncbi:MAG TPA: phosphoenolpyruvate--protein phosphotransferase, partial [Spirochaetales bacterium]|nr:phosphoenolpyruvate--protein phosphotransferase [Spirochaetales bacterium]
VAHGADGVGLFRSEFLFLGRAGGPPDEDEQYAAYRRVVETMAGKPVTIRTLDIGGDKALPELAELEERNPLLGWRAIRFCLSRKDIFHAQLRAILRASVHGEVRVMFPMISGAAELDEALDALGEAKDELKALGRPFDPEVKVGIMIEVPSAAMTADILARHSAFFSIGTNDLIQYSVAVDRGNERVAYLHQPFHPAVLRLVRFTIESAHAAGIPAGMCGEMASDPYAAALLLGLGLDEFSMSSVSIPEVRRLIRSISMERARALAVEALSLGSPLEIDRLLRERLDPEVGVLLR